jgi:outer membrane protein OmpA-like peptidoglycan-associated protein
MRVGTISLFFLLCLTSWARAQVSVDMHALDPVGPGQPSGHTGPARSHRPEPVPDTAAGRKGADPAARGRATANGTTANGTTAGATPAAPADAPSGSRGAVRQPSAPPTAGNVPPLANSATGGTPGKPPIPALPTEQPSAAPASTTVPASAQAALPLPAPVRLVFEDGKTDLTRAEEAAIKELAHAIPAPEASSINVMAYAAGKPDDPSTARRLSLSRGLAVRSVLLASGVPSAQIYVRALGATASEGPADRVELIVARIGTVTR